MLSILKSKTFWILIGLALLITAVVAGVNHYTKVVGENKDLKQSIQVTKAINDNLTDQQRAQAGVIDKQAQITIQVQKEGEKIKEEIRNEEPKKDQTVSPRVAAAIRGVSRMHDHAKD